MGLKVLLTSSSVNTVFRAVGRSEAFTDDGKLVTTTDEESEHKSQAHMGITESSPSLLVSIYHKFVVHMNL